MTHEAPPQLRDVVITVVTILVVCAIGLGILEWRRPQPSDVTHSIWSEHPPSTRTDLVGAKNRLIDRLDNFELEDALEDCEILIEAAPADKLGWRNQVIARLLAVDREANPVSAIDPAAEPQAYKTALESAHAAVGQLVKADPESAVSHYLAARLAHLRHDWSAVAAALEKAEKKDPENPRYPYAWFDLCRDADDAAVAQQRMSKLARAAQLAPQNLAVALEWVQSQSGEDIPELQRGIVRVRALAEPYAEWIRASAEVDILNLLDRALECCTASDPDGKGALEHARQAAKALQVASVATRDARSLRPHPLEFVVHDFADDSGDDLSAPGATMPDAVAVSFIRLAAERQIPLGSEVRAVRFADIDLDGLVDAVVLRKQRLEVYTPTSGSPGWRLLSARTLPAPANGFVLADLDHDIEKGTSHVTGNRAGGIQSANCAAAHLDAIVYGDFGILVLQNSPSGETGERLWEPAGQREEFAALKNVIAVAAADLDQDGNLDLLVSSAHGLSVWVGTGKAGFATLPLRSLLPQAAPTTLLAADVNRDARVDFVVTGTDLLGAGLLENLGAGQLRWRPFPVTYTGLEGARALTILDADGNASWDFLASTARGLTLAQTSTVECAVVFRAGKLISSDQFALIRLCDYDNDGYRDVFAAELGGSGIAVFRGGSHGNFVAVEGLFGADTGMVTALDVDDFDADGDLDVIAAIDGQAVVFVNEGGNANHSLRIATRSESRRHSDDGESVRYDHIQGGLLETKVGSLYQAQVIERPWTHFGLGKRPTAEIARVVWPGGSVEHQVHCGGNVVLCRRDQPRSAGCHLFSWNGDFHEFIGKVLTHRPLNGAGHGAQPAQEAEAVRIAGESLLPANGEYRLQVADDSCGASYIDSVRLIAVDHPAGSEVFVNERAVDDEAAPLVVAVSRPRSPLSVRDGRGEDVRPKLYKEDGRYVSSLRHLSPSRAEPHVFEIELGELDEARSVTLYLTGWCSAGSTLIPQTSGKAAGAALSVSIPDQQGRWQELPQPVTFPAGRTATAAIELAGAFAAGDYRVRIETHLEIYWDRVFFTDGEEPAPVHLTELPLLAADLHYRGFSRTEDGTPGMPRTYAYDAPESARKWMPMRGRFTRYGDVGGLLEERDDRLVVVGGGDELTVRFAPSAEPAPDGWKRDFVLHCAGWSKQADVNVSAGDCCEPLPFGGMNGYPVFADAKPREGDGREYEKYLQTYQTRRQNWHAFWKHVRYQPSPSSQAAVTVHPFSRPAP